MQRPGGEALPEVPLRVESRPEVPGPTIPVAHLDILLPLTFQVGTERHCRGPSEDDGLKGGKFTMKLATRRMNQVQGHPSQPGTPYQGFQMPRKELPKSDIGGF